MINADDCEYNSGPKCDRSVSFWNLNSGPFFFLIFMFSVFYCAINNRRTTEVGMAMAMGRVGLVFEDPDPSSLERVARPVLLRVMCRGGSNGSIHPK